jgi:hypothetical protein
MDNQMLDRPLSTAEKSKRDYAKDGYSPPPPPLKRGYVPPPPPPPKPPSKKK